MKKILVSLLLITVLMIPTAVMAQDMEMETDGEQQPAEQSLNQENKVVATVNGEEITSQQLEANVNQILQQVNQVDRQLTQILLSSEAGNTVLEELQKAKLEGIISMLLLEQEAEEQNITISQEEKDEMYEQQKNSIMQQNDWNEEEFLTELQKDYEDEAAFKNELLNELTNNPNILINKLIEQEVMANLEENENQNQAIQQYLEQLREEAEIEKNI